ncbi:MAG: hypothetical protein GTO17_10095 [Candidatus Aminicenantes bacterium]|nr:hypothetical protein [Candidatus Aminicenantes bacterium]
MLNLIPLKRTAAKGNKTSTFIKSGLGFGFIILVAVMNLSAERNWHTTIYFDYTHDLTKDGYLTASRVDQNNRFRFRRAYFNYENKISKNIKFRFRYDADRRADEKFRPFLKHLYLEWSELIPRSKMKIGMIETLTWNPTTENKWGYRSVAKTLLDNYEDATGQSIDASAADLGISLSGVITKEVRYAFMVSNGSGYAHPENDKYKKFTGRLSIIPTQGLSFLVYIDYEKQSKEEKAVTYKADAFMEIVEGLVIGGEWFVYDNEVNKIDDKQFNRSGFSVFGRYAVMPDQLNVFARYDHYEPNTEVEEDDLNLIIAGLDYIPVNNSFKIQPNIWFYSYADPEKKNDIVFNLTFYFTF